MGEALKRKDYLSLLSKSKSKKRRDALINLATSQEILAIVECILNILQGNVKIPAGQFKKLKRHKNILRDLVRRKTSIKKKRSILKQKGGSILPMLLPLALNTLTSLFK